LNGCADPQDEILFDDAAKPLKLRGEAVWAGHQTRNQKGAVGGRRGFANRSAFLVRDDNGDAGQNAMLFIGDASAD
jgi:hypothetical protein